MKGITIFDFDQSILGQPDFLECFKSKLTIKSMSKFRRLVRLWCSSVSFSKVSATMQLENPNQLVLLGSGDYHHLTLALLQQHQAPFTLVLFDNHPDWIRPPHQYHCGTWVYSAARLPNVERIIIIGLENGDLAGKKFMKGDVESYLKQKIVLLPYSPVEVEIQGQETIQLQSRLKHSLKAGVQEILAAIRTKHVYISVDKDCLRQQDAVTNWEQGTLPLETLLLCVRAICETHVIIGADTVGDYSPPIFSSPLKWIGSWLDRPENALRMKMQLRTQEVNSIANLKLAAALGFTG